MWEALPTYTKFLWRGHVPGCVAVFRLIRVRFVYSEVHHVKNKVWGWVEFLIFEFDMTRENALKVQLHPSFCLKGGCSLCLP